MLIIYLIILHSILNLSISTLIIFGAIIKSFYLKAINELLSQI